MSTGLTVAVVVIVVLALLVIAALVARRARNRRELRRERLSEQAGGHRQEAEAHDSRVRELGEERKALRTEAAEQSELSERHARLAEEHEARAEDFEAEIV